MCTGDFFFNVSAFKFQLRPRVKGIARAIHMLNRANNTWIKKRNTKNLTSTVKNRKKGKESIFI